jgi:hypothetical protein
MVIMVFMVIMAVILLEKASKGSRWVGGWIGGFRKVLGGGG